MLDIEGRGLDRQNIHSEAGLKYLESLVLGTRHDTKTLRQNCRNIRHLNEELDMLDKRITEEAARNEYASILTSMTGVGPYTALLLAVEIADINRFPTPKHLVSWAGLCPTVHQSGDTKYHGKTKKMDVVRQVNWVICEAANTASGSTRG